MSTASALRASFLSLVCVAVNSTAFAEDSAAPPAPEVLAATVVAPPPPAPPVEDVSLLIFPSPTKVRGALAPQRDAVAARVEQGFKQNVVCLRRSGPKEEPTAVSVVFKVTPDGAVKEPKVTMIGGGNTEGSKCLQDAVSGWAFPVAAGESRVTHKVTFQKAALE